MFENADRPLQLRDFQTALLASCKLRVSRPYLGYNLMTRLNARYRLIKPIDRDPMVQIIKAMVQVQKPGPVLFIAPRIWDLDHTPISNFDHRELILHISTKRSVALLT